MWGWRRGGRRGGWGLQAVTDLIAKMAGVGSCGEIVRPRSLRCAGSRGNSGERILREPTSNRWRFLSLFQFLKMVIKSTIMRRSLECRILYRRRYSDMISRPAISATNEQNKDKITKTKQFVFFPFNYYHD